MLQILPLNSIQSGSQLEVRWEDMIGSKADIFYKLHYLRIVQQAEEGPILLAVFEENNNLALYPFVLRPIRHLQQGRFCDGELYYDIINPYEYGGPIIYGEGNPKFVDTFLEAFKEFCSSNRIVSEFTRLHPFHVNYENLNKFYDIKASCENIYIDLSASEDQIFADYDAQVRRGVRLGQKRGVTVDRVPLNQISTFKKLYFDTMDRVKANARYYFSEDFFTTLAAEEMQDIWLYHAKASNDQIAAAAIFIVSNEICHYFLCGREILPRDIYVNNNFFFHKVIMDAKKEGCRYFHLGGANNIQRGLIRFKQGFSNQRVDYFTARFIHNKTAYEMLVNDHEELYPEATMAYSSPHFFPKYREGLKGLVENWHDCSLPDSIKQYMPDNIVF